VTDRSLFWANLLQLGSNLWNDRPNTPERPARDEKGCLRDLAWGVSDSLRFDERVWTHLTGRMHEIGMNMLVIDLAEGLEYPSHPELAVKNTKGTDHPAVSA